MSERPFFARALKATVGAPQHAEVGLRASPLFFSGEADWGRQYYPVCDSDRYTLYQTWNATTSGNMTELAINIAATEQTEALNVELFRVENENEECVLQPLATPQTKVSSLTHRNPLWWTYVQRSDFSYTLNTINLRPKVYVHAGDRMGFKISSRDRKPYCHAEYQKGEVVCTLNKQMNIKLCQPEQTESGRNRHVLYEESLAEGPQEIVVRNSTMKFFVYVE